MFGKTPSPEPADSAQLRLREMEQLLKEREEELRKKDKTVQELTERLSQTVERLDRFQRLGSDHSVIRTAAFPKEVVEQQTELVGDLQRAVQMWEEMQTACGLSRLETQVSDLKSLFEEHFREDDPEAETEETAESEADSEADGSETVSQEEENAEAADSDQEAAEQEEDWDDLEEEICPLRPPEILNLDQADEAALRRCAQQQDQFIDYLSGRLQRTAEKKTAVDWSSLAENPERLTRHLDHTAALLQQSRHFAEFELALQRTRLKRHERELAMITAELESQMQSLPRVGSGSQESGSAQNRRWLRMLGVNKDDQ